MEYILFLTYSCNLNCSYCFAKNLVQDNEKSSLSITRENIELICEYIENDIKVNDRKNNSIVFFGGEPSLVPNIILDIIEKTTHLDLHYSIYTNGLLLNELSDTLLRKFQSILVAIDGDKEAHETYKPIGSYDKVLSNLNDIRKKTNAQIIGRITMEENTNIYQSVSNLLNHFDYVHWQIVNKESFDNPTELINNYTENLQKLFDEWKTALQIGTVLNIIPFNRIVLSLLKNEEFDSFRCECGYLMQAIDIYGNIYLCDEYIENPSYSLGNIRDDKFNMTSYKSHYDLFEDCSKCDISSICLGRCRKSLETQSLNQIRIYCALTKVLVNMILQSMEEIRQIISEQKVDIARLHTEFYDTEIIP